LLIFRFFLVPSDTSSANSRLAFLASRAQSLGAGRLRCEYLKMLAFS
jgi:hypothetical protein